MDNRPSTPKKNVASFITHLSPTQKSPANASTYMEPKFDPITDQNIKGVCNAILMAAMTNCDSVLREIGECIIQRDEYRWKVISKQIDAQGKKLGEGS